MNIIYSKKNFNIYRVGKSAFIVHNKNKKFKYGHTHINNYNTAKWIIDLAIYTTVPKRSNKYILDSLIRISKDEIYISLLKDKIKSTNKVHLNNHIKERKVIKNGNA